MDKHSSRHELPEKHKSGWFSLSMKSSLFLIVLLLMSLSLLGLLTLKSIKTYQQQQLEASMAGRARTANLYLGQMLLARQGGTAPEQLLKDRARELVTQLSNERALMLDVYDLKGNLLATSKFLQQDATDVQVLKEGVQLAKQNQIVYKTWLSANQQETRVEYFAPLFSGEKVIGVLHFTYNDQNAYAFYQKIRKMILTTGSVVFIAGLLLALWYFGRMTRAVKKLEVSVNLVQRGNYKGVELLKRNDELGTLSQGIGNMAQTIEQAMEGLKTEHEKLTLAIGKLKAMEENQRVFFGQITHEFKTPLSVINAYNDLAAMYSDDPTLLQNTREQIGEEVRKLSGMVEQALEMAKLEKYEFELSIEKVQLKDVLEASLERLSVKIEKYNITVNKMLEPAEIRGDQQMMSQIFINLLDNAIKYNVASGVIWVDMVCDTETVKIVLENTGEGLSEQVMERLFEAYIQDDHANQTEFRGTGLGLPLVRRLVALQKGEINVTTGTPSRHTQGLKGCRVEIAFPRAKSLS